MRDLAIYVLSWNRPHFLERTVQSIKDQIGDLTADIHVIDNGSKIETVSAILHMQNVVKIFLSENYGVCGGFENGVPENIHETHRYILTSDHDMFFTRPLYTYMEMLEANQRCFVAMGFHTPEHQPENFCTFRRREWMVKTRCSGGALMMRSPQWQQLRPFNRGKDYAWQIWDSMLKLDPDRRVYVLPGTILHMGWRKGDSTWKPEQETPGDRYHGT